MQKKIMKIVGIKEVEFKLTGCLKICIVIIMHRDKFILTKALTSHLSNLQNNVMNNSTYLKSIFILTFIILTSVCEGQNPQWVVYTTQNSGLPSNSVGDVAFDTNNIKWIGTGNGVARFDGIHWTVYDTSNSPIPDFSSGVIAVDKKNIVWIGTHDGGLVKFDGVNWTVYDTNNSEIPSNQIFDIKVDDDNVKWMGTFNKGLIKFDDSTFEVFNTGNSGICSNIAWTLALEKNIKWVGTFDFNGGISKYNDTSWVTYNSSNSGLPINTVSSIYVDLFDIKWITTRFGGIAKFNSVQKGWTVYNRSNSGLPDNNLISVTTQNQIKWIGTEGAGLVKFDDTTWTIFNPKNSPLPSISVTRLIVDRYNNLWISTQGGLAIYNPNGVVSVTNNQIGISKFYSLFQNFPNPFNPITKIKFEITKRTFVTLKIFDILGGHVKTLVNNNINSGYYNIIFDGTDLQSGIYFYQLQADGFSVTKKMLLVK